MRPEQHDSAKKAMEAQIGWVAQGETGGRLNCVRDCASTTLSIRRTLNDGLVLFADRTLG